jgi:Membrane dipeptidase (Peptidase family M19)
VQLIGPNHVGIGLDYVFDQEELETLVRENPETFPPSEYRNVPQAFVRPEQLPEIAEHLARLGYDEAALSAIGRQSPARCAAGLASAGSASFGHRGRSVGRGWSTSESEIEPAVAPYRDRQRRLRRT